jgi:predicted transcriptional regulator
MESTTRFKRFLGREGISQADLARKTTKTTAFIAQLVNGDCGASLSTVDLILSSLTEILGRPVSYEELWDAPGSPVESPVSNPTEEPAA